VRNGALEPNLLEWEVLTRSRKPFPVPSSAALRRINFAVLLLSGDRSLPLLRRSVDQLAVLVQGSRRVSLRNATHDMWSETPDACGAALRKFLREKGRRIKTGRKSSLLNSGHPSPQKSDNRLDVPRKCPAKIKVLGPHQESFRQASFE
jgi:hypothetical protein